MNLAGYSRSIRFVLTGSILGLHGLYTAGRSLRTTMNIEFSVGQIEDCCREYQLIQKNQSPLELDVKNRWVEEQEMMGKFPTRFQEDGRIKQLEDFKLLTRWKWPGLWSNHAKKNSRDRVDRITNSAFRWRTNDPSESPETILRDQIGDLTCLDGVRPAMASVVLTFWRPDEYTVMDDRALTALAHSTDEKYRWTGRRDASRKQYPAYVDTCKRLRHDLGQNISLREIDRALWVLGGGY